MNSSKNQNEMLVIFVFKQFIENLKESIKAVIQRSVRPDYPNYI